MRDIDTIMKMLDETNSEKIQQKGLRLARKVENFNVFLRPASMEDFSCPWDNCAIIVSEKSDVQLEQYLKELLDWVAEPQIPGAMVIMNRLIKFSKVDKLAFVMEAFSVKLAIAQNDHRWLWALSFLLKNEKLMCCRGEIFRLRELNSHYLKAPQPLLQQRQT